VSNDNMPIGSTVAAERSFVGPALLSWVMYYVGFYVVGLVLNIKYLSDSKEIQDATGKAPAGRGCLWALLIVHLWVPAMVIFVAVIASLVGGVGVLGVLGDWWREGTGMF